MVLAPVYITTIHIDSSDAEISGFRDWDRNSSPAIFAAVQFRFCHPPFFDPLPHEGAEVFVVGVPWAVVFIQEGLEILSRGSVQHDRLSARILRPVVNSSPKKVREALLGRVALG